MADPKKEPEKSSDWGWDKIWSGPGMPFFFIGLTFVFIGIGNVTFLIIGIVFIGLAFAMKDETEDDEPPTSGGPDPTGPAPTDEEKP